MGSKMGRQHSAGCLRIRRWLTRTRDHEYDANSPRHTAKLEKPIFSSDTESRTVEPFNLFLRMDPDFFYAVTSCLFLDELPRLCEVSQWFRERVCEGNCAEHSRGLRLSDGLVRYLFEVDQERQFLLRESQRVAIEVPHPHVYGHRAAVNPSDRPITAGTPTPHTAQSASYSPRAFAGEEHNQSNRLPGGGYAGVASHLIHDGGAAGETKPAAVFGVHKYREVACGMSPDARSSNVQEGSGVVPTCTYQMLPGEQRRPVMEGLLQRLLTTKPRLRVLVVNCKEDVPVANVLAETLMPTQSRGDSDVKKVGPMDDELLLNALFNPGRIFERLDDASESIFHISRLAACDFIADGVFEETCLQFSVSQGIVVQHYGEILNLQEPVLPSLGVLAPPDWLASSAGAAFRKRVQTFVDHLEACLLVLPVDCSGTVEVLSEEVISFLRERRHKIVGFELRRTSTVVPERATPAMTDLLISNMFLETSSVLRIARITCRTRLEVHQSFIAGIVGLIKQTPTLDVVEVSVVRSTSEAHTPQYRQQLDATRRDLREMLSKGGFYDREVNTERCDVLLFFRKTKMPTGAHNWKLHRKGYDRGRFSKA
ncbi:hypothetical protein TGFOU_224470 [Toxoplasma gondii FOU]|uniref:Uncharacterized protein n=3 Tax=Toxoplasma gondii TaxID=5811 RepID=A0A086JLP2_TOXGO|nr:hypothetical protein TGFOU_224470 [Toxoplasma gondii FOU]PUA91348.1 hypothetical protein TGBR9_224470 [Toxoplasma gondii TgCATBr9]RQX74708.1 hypothetical protein TGCAST_224470 [Toxoplasma gondii CAST]